MTIGNIQIRKFEFFYFFFMVIQMAYMTVETRVIPGGLSHPIAWSIPFVLTIVIVKRNKISFNNTHFILFLLLCLFWSSLQLIVKPVNELRVYGLYFSFIYTIIIAYIHIAVYGRNLFALYEHCMVIMCKIAIPLWLFSNIFPSISASFAYLFPGTGYGRNILWLYCWMDPSREQVQGFLTRNAGCSWEPGRFAVMLCLAIAVNLLYNGISWKKNKNIKWLLATLVTTFSTTGYVITAFMYLLCLITKKTFSAYFSSLFFFLLFLGIGINVSFLGSKLSQKFNVEEEISAIDINEDWYDSEEKKLAIDRFPSMIFEFQNFVNDPWLGYGKDRQQSKFAKEHTTYYSTTGGLIQMISVYGVFLGLFLYYILFKSSVKTAGEFGSKCKHLIFSCILLSLTSYPLFEYSIFSSFWLYYLFSHSK